MERGLEARKAIESKEERQRREAQETYAQKHGYSKKSSVYIWEQDDADPTFYRRTLLSKAEVEVNWGNFTARQRRFWSHKIQWDLCPQISPFDSEESSQAEQARIADLDDSEDEDFSPLYSKPPTQQNEKLAEAMLESVRAAVARDAEATDSPQEVRILDVVDYLQKRHGFYPRHHESWNPNLHDPSSAVQKAQHELAAKHLLHKSTHVEQTSTLTSIVDFRNTALKSNVSYKELPCAWDISRFGQVNPLICKMSRILLERVTSKLPGSNCLYLLRPPKGSKDTSPWFIATTSPTVVLLVYRSPWKTMSEICRGLLDLGIPFRTVAEASHPPQSERDPQSRGLGFRPRNFQPTKEDYAFYEQARDQVLSSSSGRAFRLRGGIAGRIASEVVPDLAVLDGPCFGDELVGCHGNRYFVDDRLTEEALDIVSGVYRVETTAGGSNISHSSWWPKNTAWHHNMVYSGDQWSSAAEEFYQKRLKDFSNGTFTMHTATEWKERHKFHRASTKRIIEGSERLAAEFIATSSRVR